jgi:hypothetical protein
LIRLFIYGGHDIREGSMGSLWMLDLSKLADLEKSDDQQERKCMWHLVDTSASKGSDGGPPGKVSHHSAVVYGDKMFMFGGSKDNDHNAL